MRETVKSMMYSSQVLEGNLDVKSDVGVILPTYCEAANIEKLIVEIENLERNVSILFIDDSSPDGTADIVRDFQRRYSNILLLARPKKSGLGTAITDGFKTFLSFKKPPKRIITMDADYSHNPKDLNRLTASLRDGYDLVIGSRYCKGGATKDWSPIRLAISKIANFIASLVIGAKIHDYTSGLRCYSTNLVRNVIEDLHSQTYEIQIETIRQAHLQGFKIKEIPITFTNRKRGKSKLALNEIKQFISYILLRIRLEKGML
jgi:dolichol-phosphate mannosyltransferase